VNVATHFDRALNVTGAILTKLDGDARGGAALSLKAVTNKPIKFAGIGEKPEDFRAVSSRAHGLTQSWGWATSSVSWKKAAETVDMERRPGAWKKKCAKASSHWKIFLSSLRAMKKMGPLESIVSMLPGGSEMVKGADMSKQEKGLSPDGRHDLRDDKAGAQGRRRSSMRAVASASPKAAV
jgi:signal recognition particle subunit SRP54